MKLVPQNAKEVAEKRRYTRVYDIVQEFIHSKEECVKVTAYTHKHAYSCASSISKCLRTHRIHTVQCFVLHGEVFLMKKEIPKV